MAKAFISSKLSKVNWWRFRTRSNRSLTKFMLETLLQNLYWSKILMFHQKFNTCTLMNITISLEVRK